MQVLNGLYAIGPIQTVGTSAGGLRESATSPFLVVGERAAIVEPGEHSQAAPFLEGVAEIGVTLDRIDYIIPTHLHLHHSTALNVLLDAIPHAKVVVHARGVAHAIEPTRLNASSVQAWGPGECNLNLNPVPEDRIIGVAGGEVFDLGGRKLEIIDAPGHAPHNFGIYDTLTKGLWCGDFPQFQSNSKRGGISINPPLFHVERGLETLRRFRACNPAVLLKWYGGIAHYQPELLIRTAEEDLLAFERICVEGMRQKLPAKEIALKLEEYKQSVGLIESLGQEVVQEDVRGPVALYRYLIQKYPDLEMPEGAIIPGRGEREMRRSSAD